MASGSSTPTLTIPFNLIDEDELTGLSLSFASLSSFTQGTFPTELKTTETQTPITVFRGNLVETETQTNQLFVQDERNQRFLLNKSKLLENEIEQQKEIITQLSALSTSLKEDNQFLEQQAAENVCHSPPPLNLSTPPSVFNVETQQEKHELLEKENQHLIAECDLAKSSLLSLVQRTNFPEENRTSELAGQTQRADHAEMFYYNLQQRFILLNNELESKCRDETGTKIQLYLSQAVLVIDEWGDQFTKKKKKGPTSQFNLTIIN